MSNCTTCWGYNIRNARCWYVRFTALLACAVVKGIRAVLLWRDLYLDSFIFHSMRIPAGSVLYSAVCALTVLFVSRRGCFQRRYHLSVMQFGIRLWAIVLISKLVLSVFSSLVVQFILRRNICERRHVLYVVYKLRPMFGI